MTEQPLDNANAAPDMPARPVLGDAFGALLTKCWERGAEPGQVLELIERDDGYLVQQTGSDSTLTGMVVCVEPQS